jgi:hypothetical protein
MPHRQRSTCRSRPGAAHQPSLTEQRLGHELNESWGYRRADRRGRRTDPNRLSPTGRETSRARLLTTIALESRGSRAGRPAAAALEAAAIARRLGDPALLAFALNGVWMQTFYRCGLAAERDAIGVEVLALSARHGLVTFEIFGRLIRLQTLGALGDFADADEQSRALDQLAGPHERPLTG